MKKFAFKHSFYAAATPKSMRKLGDALLAAGTVIAVGGIWQFDTLKEIFTPVEIKWMIGGSIFLGAAGKFITNFFKEEDTKETPPTPLP
jgi:hypothetical protein